jgi:S-formylglutathione hydrolase FrmB
LFEGAFAQRAKDMIVLFPDSRTVHNGSVYSNSVTTGDFELFIAHDVVAWIDARYRTIPRRSRRGLVGDSVGGCGAFRIGMKHANVFGSLYIMSPCCVAHRGAGPANPATEKAVPFGPRAQLASTAAWSPNPKNPPLYLDLLVKDGLVQQDVIATGSERSAGVR